jgi:hypothetical protein
MRLIIQHLEAVLSIRKLKTRHAFVAETHSITELKNLSVKTYKTENVLVIVHEYGTFYLLFGAES